MARARAAGLRAVPTGIDHGTITVIADGVPFEVTTLREDLETDGRHATVRFGRSWQHDAERRDFTINALYVTAEGEVIDLVGGLADIAARRVRFIGDAATRIAEDRLRVLRFFRFQATYGADPPDPVSLAAAVAGRDGLNRLSAERVGAEVVKLVRAPGAASVLRLMGVTGVAEVVFGQAVDVEAFAALASEVGRGADEVPIRLASLLSSPADALKVAERLRLSNAQRDRMVGIHEAMIDLTGPVEAADARLVRRHLFRLGPRVFWDAIPVVAAKLRQPERAAWARQTIIMPDPLPVTSADLMACDIKPGPAFGRALARATEVWIASDFTASKDMLVAAALSAAAEA
jgi:tRNA nucleotidyltransferase/poly(A) polymerase